MAVRAVNSCSIFRSAYSSPPQIPSLSALRCRRRCFHFRPLNSNLKLGFSFSKSRLENGTLFSHRIRFVHSLVDTVMEELEAMRSRKRIRARSKMVVMSSKALVEDKLEKRILQKGLLLEFRKDSERLLLAVAQKPDGKKNWMVSDQNGATSSIKPQQVTYIVPGVEDFDHTEIADFIQRAQSLLDASLLEYAWAELLEKNKSVTAEELAEIIYGSTEPLESYSAQPRLQIGSLEFKKKALDSLFQLLQDDDKNSVLVAKQGDVGYLIHLLDVNNQSSIREQAVAAVSVLASASESSRKIVFEEGGLGPLLRLLETGSMPVKEKAAAAIEAITADPENAWAVSAYGGVPTLIDACRSGSPVMQMHASGAMRNVSVVEDVRVTMAEEGAIPVLVDLLISSGAAMQGNAAHCLWILASSGEEFRVSIVQEGGLQRLLQLVQEPPNPDTIEYALRAIYALLSSAPTAKALSSSTGFVSQLGELIKQGNVGLQQISASLICNLSLSDDRKRAISGCMAALVKMLELAKPVGMQDIAARALVSLLSVRSNRKDFVREEKNLMRLVQMLDPKNEGVCKNYPISVVSAVTAGGSGSCRKRLVAAGACQHLQVLTDMDVAGAKKVLQRLAGSRLKNIFNRTWRE